MATGGSKKASFTSYEIKSDGTVGAEVESFSVQYNPKEIKSDKASKWQKKDKQGAEGAQFEYQQGEPRTLVMDLFFDTSIDDMGNVEKKWVTGLLRMTNPSVTAPDGGDKKYPPLVTFVWGDFKFTGIVDKIAVQYLMFNSNGDPVRAKANVSMKEYTLKEFDKGTGGAAVSANLVDLSGQEGTIDTRDLTVIEAQAGDTANSLANEHGTSYQAVCDANGIDDPNEDLAGQEIVIPSGSSSSSSSGDSGSDAAAAADAASDGISTAADLLDSAEAVYSSASDLF